MKKIFILVLLIGGIALSSFGMQEQKQPSFCDTVFSICWEEAGNAQLLAGYTFDEAIEWADSCEALNGC